MTSAGIGSDIDFVKELGIDDENIPEFRFIWNINSTNTLRLTYSDLSYSGDRRINQTIYFDGRTYNIGSAC